MAMDRFYTELLLRVLTGNPCGVSGASVRADIACLERRCAGEGFHFVLHGLPAFAKALESALENGQYQVPTGFRRSVRNPGLPAFMQDVLLVVFDKDGVIRKEVDWLDLEQDPAPDAGGTTPVLHVRVAAAVAHVRQVGYMFYKLDLPYPELVAERKLQDWLTLEESLPEPEYEYDDSDGFFSEVAREVERLVGEADLVDIKPRHGPGSVSTGEVGDEKWAFKRTYQSLSASYDLSYFTVGGVGAVAERKEWRHGFDHLEGGVSNLVQVPKDARGPREVAPEPLEFQWIQQGQALAYVPLLERNSRKRINFEDQTINAELALSSSRTRQFATLDLKDASNRVTLALVRQIWPKGQLRLVEASRSEATTTPYGVVRLKKFAGMGSALCFPVEATIFWAVAVVAIAQVKPGRRRWIRRHVYTYGDDLVVPREYARVVMAGLERAGLVVNTQKSFVNGFFRESCGTDAFAGIDVTPQRIKKSFPWGARGSVSLLSWAEYAFGLQTRGYAAAAEWIYREVEALVGHALPYGAPGCGYLCRFLADATLALVRNHADPKVRMRYQEAAHPEPSYQRFEVKALRPVKPGLCTLLSGWDRLLRNLTMPQDDPDASTLRVEVSVLRPRWCAV